jgi:hypothetical protein
MSEQEAKPSVDCASFIPSDLNLITMSTDAYCPLRHMFLASRKRKTSSNSATASAPPKKRTKVIPGSSLPPQGFTGTVLAANHPTVVYELLERILEEATAEHRRIVAERYGFDVKHLHFAWRTIKWVSRGPFA